MHSKLLQLLAAIAVLPEVEEGLTEGTGMSVHFLGDGEFQVEFTRDMPTNYDAKVILQQTPEVEESKPALGEVKTAAQLFSPFEEDSTGRAKSTAPAEEVEPNRLAPVQNRSIRSLNRILTVAQSSAPPLPSSGSSEGTDLEYIQKIGRVERPLTSSEPNVRYTRDGIVYRTPEGEWISATEWSKRYEAKSSTPAPSDTITPEQWEWDWRDKVE